MADLDRSVAWYQGSLDLRVHAHEIARAALGDGQEAVVVLHEAPQARPAGRTVQLPTDADVAQLRERLEHAGREVEAVSGGFEVRDPWGTAVAVVSIAVTGLRSPATVSTAKPSPYLLQTARHFRHKLGVRFDEQHAVIPFAFNHAQLPGEAAAVAAARRKRNNLAVCTARLSTLVRLTGWWRRCGPSASLCCRSYRRASPNTCGSSIRRIEGPDRIVRP